MLNLRERKYLEAGEIAYNLYSLPNIIRFMNSRRMRWVDLYHMGEMKNVCRILIRKSENSGQLRKYRRRWEYNIKIDFQKMRVKTSNRFVLLWV